ncbi:UDP-4-amino-4,6-dideoxy-N-acetyl-beta-L-altrosamine transaminase, partial [Prochlorococcus sp. AH-736-P13]
MINFFRWKFSKRFIPYGKQSINNEDIKSVKKAMKSALITQGPLTKEFEEKIANKVGAEYSVSFNSATSALHIACKALGLEQGDYLWTSPITFVASANCGLYCGAKVDFVDIDPNTGLISIEKLKEKLDFASKNNTLPKIIIPVHLAGSSCNMKEISKLGAKYNFKIIEDASHAIGGKYNDKYIGNCEYSSICIFSFHPVKIITTGEGGMATTNEFNLFNLMQKLSSHGIVRDQSKFLFEPNGVWSYEQQTLGYNFRITEIQAALGISQLKRLDYFVKKRNQLHKIYTELFENEPIRMLEIPKDSYSALHLAIIRLNDTRKGSHKFIFEEMRKNNIGVQLHYQPVHLQPYYKKLGFKEGDFPNAEVYGH